MFASRRYRCPKRWLTWVYRQHWSTCSLCVPGPGSSDSVNKGLFFLNDRNLKEIQRLNSSLTHYVHVGPNAQVHRQYDGFEITFFHINHGRVFYDATQFADQTRGVYLRAQLRRLFGVILLVVAVFRYPKVAIKEEKKIIIYELPRESRQDFLTCQSNRHSRTP